MADEPRLVRRTRTIAQRQGVRRRQVVLGAGLVATLLLVLGAGWLFLVPAIPWFKVDRTAVIGLKGDSREVTEIEAAVRQATIGLSTLRPDGDRLEQILSRFPRVADVRLETDFPDAATVEVKLREDGSIAEAKPDDLLVATDGRVLGKFDSSRSDTLPVLGGGPVLEEPGEWLEGEVLDQALVAGAAPTELRSFISIVETGQSGVEAGLTDGSVLIFGDSSSAKAKWAAAATVIADSEMAGDIEVIDVSVPRRPGVLLADGTEIETDFVIEPDVGEEDPAAETP